MSDEAEPSPSEEFLKALAHVPAVDPPAPEVDMVGQTAGRYRVLSRLGEGGMGIVYRAKDSVLGREVALKVLPQDVMRDAARRRRFLREARLAAAINHPNLVAIYDVGEADERIYLAMELVDGEPLRSKLASGPMDVGEVVRIGADMARGIARAHAAGIVHRDLKPENVMVASDGTVKILDFGIATIRATGTDGTTPTESGGSESDLGLVVGTPSYMSPEQAKLREITDKSDCFALGVVLYEMLTGRRPFTGTTAFEIVIAIDRDAPEPLEVARPGMPPALADVVMKCLEKDPERRPTAEAVVRALAAIDLSSAAREIADPSPPVRVSKARYLWGAAFVGIGLVAVLVLGRDPAPSAKRDTTIAGTDRAPSAGVAPSPGESVAVPNQPPAPAAVSGSASPSASASASATASASASAVRGGANKPAAPGASQPAPSAPAVPSVAPALPSARDPLADPI